MSKHAHTPGPWSVISGNGAYHRDRYIRCEQLRPGAEVGVAVAKTCSAHHREIQVDANARLIAAAPDLLAACEAVAKLPYIVGAPKSMEIYAEFADRLGKGDAADFESARILVRQLVATYRDATRVLDLIRPAITKATRAPT